MNSNTSFGDLIADALAHPIQGWDFSYVAGRYIWHDPPWAYGDNALPYIEQVDSMLDVDTGGGEDLLGLYKRAKRWPASCWAAEAYDPNVPIASERLAAIGVQVRHYRHGEPLPFATATQTEGFDLILNRHGAMLAGEYARILKPGGIFVTQQVGGEMNIALNRLLNAPSGEYSDQNMAHTVEILQAAGFKIVVAQEAKPSIQFTDIGAIVWYLQSVPWQIPRFTVEQYEAQLRRLHAQILANGPVQSQGHLYYVEATLRK